MGVLGVPLYSIHWWCNQKNLQVPEPPVYRKMLNLPVISVLTMGILHTKQPPYDFLNLYGACLQAPRTSKMKYEVRQSIPVPNPQSRADYLLPD
jgi:hypothetical protein